MVAESDWRINVDPRFSKNQTEKTRTIQYISPVARYPGYRVSILASSVCSLECEVVGVGPREAKPLKEQQAFETR